MIDVEVGQLWVRRWPGRSGRTARVTKVDRALVWTDQGQHTVFSVNRDWRLVEHADGTVVSTEPQSWHIAFADRPGFFTRDRDEALWLARTCGAEFVQERFGYRDIVWTAS